MTTSIQIVFDTADPERERELPACGARSDEAEPGDADGAGPPLECERDVSPLRAPCHSPQAVGQTGDAFLMPVRAHQVLLGVIAHPVIL